MECKFEENLRDDLGKFIFLSMNLRRIKLNEIGLYPGQPIILKLIECNPGLSQKELAEVAQISRPTLNVMLGRFQKNGLVDIKYDKNNSKISKVYLTEKGKDKSKKANEVIRNFNNIQFSNFTPEEKEEFIKLIKRMCDNLEKEIKEAEYENN